MDEELKEKNTALSQSYVAAINKMAKVTAETIKNIVVMPNVHRYSDVINEELFNRKYYTTYISSKTQAKEAFVVEYERMDVLWQPYLSIIKSASGYGYTRPPCIKIRSSLK